MIAELQFTWDAMDFGRVILLILFSLLPILLAYLVIKAAVRNGILEAAKRLNYRPVRHTDNTPVAHAASPNPAHGHATSNPAADALSNWARH